MSVGNFFVQLLVVGLMLKTRSKEILIAPNDKTVLESHQTPAKVVRTVL